MRLDLRNRYKAESKLDDFQELIANVFGYFIITYQDGIFTNFYNCYIKEYISDNGKKAKLVEGKFEIVDHTDSANKLLNSQTKNHLRIITLVTFK